MVDKSIKNFDVKEICSTFLYISWLWFMLHRGADKSLARPGRKKANISVRMVWISFGALPCRKKKLDDSSVSMLLKWRASLTCFGTCFFPGLAKDLSAPRYMKKRHYKHSEYRKWSTDTVLAVMQLPRSRKWQSENNWTCNMY